MEQTITVAEFDSRVDSIIEDVAGVMAHQATPAMQAAKKVTERKGKKGSKIRENGRDKRARLLATARDQLVKLPGRIETMETDLQEMDEALKVEQDLLSSFEEKHGRALVSLAG